MPFTISHAAAVLPLSRTRLPLAALMIGSMTPDFAYFLPWQTGNWSHSIPGLITFCWPAAMAAWLVFVHLLEAPTLALLPDRWRAVFPASDRALTPRNLALASIAVVLGAATHVFWDWFTHGNTPIVNNLYALKHTSIDLLGKAFPTYRFLQHLSTVIGLAILTAWASRLRATDTRRTHSPTVRAASHGERVIALVVLLTLSTTFAIIGFFTDGELSFGRRLFHCAIGGMAGWALAWIVVSAFLQVRLRSQPQAL
jgi:hypothetical protein